MMVIVKNRNTEKYFKDVLNQYKEQVYTEYNINKRVKFSQILDKAMKLWEEEKYLEAKGLFFSVYDEIRQNKMFVDKYMISSLENNIANCYAKMQDLETYKNYSLLQQAELYYKRAAKHTKELPNGKGIIYFNYAFFNLKLRFWKENDAVIKVASHHQKAMEKINRYVYSKRRSLRMYKYFIISQRYNFRSEVTNEIVKTLADRIF